jgi:ubiquinone/menaquinone biosynthesis C-methylase UbiE
MTVDPLARAGFSRTAAQYERARPTYAAEAVRWIADEAGLGPGTTVVDLGAGTGKFTRLLVETGARVVAVEPLDEMRAQLSRVLPEVEALRATADAVPLPDGSARAVTAAQAYHWFGPDAPVEIRRLLQPDGVLALLWNERDPDDPLSAALEEFTERGRPGFGHDPGWQAPLDDSEFYGPLLHRRFPHRVDETIEERVGTVSYVGAMDERERQAFLGEVRRLCADFGVDSSRPAPMSYVTVVHLTRAR